MDTTTRTDKAMRNMIVNTVSQVCVLMANFLARTVFIRTLSADYFGLNGLFTNILTILSLAEMGMGNAIIFSMYLPLSKKRDNEVLSLLQFYRKVYQMIGVIVAVLGCLLIPFLPYLVNSKEIDNLYLIYFLYLGNTVGSYFFAYKRSILIADQKSYICMLCQTSLIIVQYIVQSVLLAITHNFLSFLITQCLTTLLVNFIITWQANRMYPEYRHLKEAEKLNKNTKTKIITNIKAIFLQKLGDVVVSNTDNILISIFVGISSVGYYSNYILIVTAVMMVLNEFFNGCTASIGNLNVSTDKKNVYHIYKVLLFINFWLCGFAMIGLFYVFNPFIEWWVGEEYMLKGTTVLLICIVFYLNQNRRVNVVFKEALGIFAEDKIRPILHAIMNIVISILLGHKLGMEGILLGTIISMFFTSFWMEPYILFRNGFKKNFKEYIFKYLEMIIITVIAFFITGCLCRHINLIGFYEIILKVSVCVIVPNIIYLISFSRTEEIKFIWNLLSEKIKK